MSRGTVHTIIGLVGDTARFQAIPFKQMPGVDHVIQIGKPYKMVARRPASRDHDGEGGDDRRSVAATFTIIAGPCAVESEEQAIVATRAAKAAGATILRGDVYKPRTSPYSFQGLGERGLEILAECRRDTGLPIIVEVVDVSQVEHVADVADCIRIGTRNAQNFELLKEVGQAQQARDAEARLGDDDRGMAAGGRVHRPARQLRDHPVRARHPHVRAVDAQHARPRRHGGRAGREPPAR